MNHRILLLVPLAFSACYAYSAPPDTDADQLVGQLSALIMGMLHDTRFLRDPRAADRTQASWDRLVKSYQP